jgi:hypothetical protein
VGIIEITWFSSLKLQGADIELIMGLVNKKAWFRAVKPSVPLPVGLSYKMLRAFLSKHLHVVFDLRFARWTTVLCIRCCVVPFDDLATPRYPAVNS